MLRKILRRLLFIVPFLALLALLTVTAARLLGVSTGGLSYAPSVAVLPDFAVPGLSDEDLRGKPVLVSFFASWCLPCLAEHPVLTEAAKHVPVYGVNFMDKDEDRTEFLIRHGNPYTKIGIDTNGAAAIAWGVEGLPTSFLLDAKGKVIYQHDGPLTETDLNHALLPLLQMEPR